MLSSNSIVSIFQTIIVLIIVIILANISLRFLNKKMNGNHKLIKIVERVNVSNNSALGIVEICGKFYLMSFAEKDNTILKELDKEEVESYLEDFQESPDLFFGMRKKD